MGHRNIVYSSLRTPDGTILTSTHVHDYVKHLDKNGKEYMLDGGTDYQKIREVVGRSGFGKNGDEEFRSSLLKDMNDEWVEASIPFVGKDSKWARIYQRELDYRKENNIQIN